MGKYLGIFVIFLCLLSVQALAENSDWEAHAKAGLAALQTKGDASLAKSEFSLALSKGISDRYDRSAMYNMRGRTHGMLGELREAMNDYNRAIKEDQSNPFPYNFRGFLLLESGQYGAAIADFNTAIKLDGSYSFAFNNRGLAKLKMGQCQEAIPDFNRSIEIDKNYAAYLNRAYCLDMLGKSKEAAKDRIKGRNMDNQHGMMEIVP